jgi:hypothetical protein
LAARFFSFKVARERAVTLVLLPVEACEIL